MQNILKSNIVFKNGAIEEITVLVEISQGDIRAIQATNKPRGGYFTIPLKAQVSNELLQEVADYGIEVKPSNVFK